MGDNEEARMAHRSRGELEAPAGWEKEVPYDIRERTFRFAVRVLQAIRQLPDDPATRVVAYQLAKSATSVGANVEEADGAESKKDFRHKIALCRKEAKETKHWIRMIVRANPERKDDCKKLWQEAQELSLIFSAILKSSK